MELRQKQKGMTLIGWMLSLAILGFFVIFGLRLTPLYLDYFSLRDMIDEISAEASSTGMTQGQIWRTLEKRLDMNYIDYIKQEHLKLKRHGKKTDIALNYEAKRPLFGNIHLVVDFAYEAKVD
jgi:hypothetical protein